jgi:hypothetical protein
MGNKICRTCGDDKPITEFYVHKQMADGYLNICKGCVKLRVKKHRCENDSVREYDRRRYWENPARMEYSKKQRKEWYANNKERSFENAKRYIRKNPEKRKAHQMVSNAIRDGKLLRQPCEICGEKGHAHHEDYLKPLEVRWLCPTHHMRHHHGIDRR